MNTIGYMNTIERIKSVWLINTMQSVKKIQYIKTSNWRFILLWTVCLFCHTAYANVYSSPTLNEANLLLDIDPKEAQALASSYLEHRQLTSATEKTPSTISRDNTDNKLRTPNSSVEALEILAQALFKQDQPEAALISLKEALALTKQYQLLYLDLEVNVLKIRLNWLRTKHNGTALQQLDQLAVHLGQLKNAAQFTPQIQYQILMLRAEIASESNENEQAEQLYTKAKSYFSDIQSVNTQIKYHIQFGQHFLNHGQYNKALTELLTAYWSALEADDGAQLAMTNTLLAQLFYERRVLDKALLYLSQAADFYDSYEQSPIWVNVMKHMGDIYYQQGKYNLALVSYLNVLDHPVTQHNRIQFISIRINLAATYLQLYNYALAEDYLEAISPLLRQTHLPLLQGKAALLKAIIASAQKQTSLTIQLALRSNQLAESSHDTITQRQALKLLSNAYEQQGNYKQALLYARQHYQLSQTLQKKLNQISEDDFKQQKKFVEQTLHLSDLERELKRQTNRYASLKNITYGIVIVCLVVSLMFLRRGYTIRQQNEEIGQLNNHLFTHSRSQLNNLRMLNVNLSSTLMQRRNQPYEDQPYEQWYMGELIYKPLNDRLRFAMIDIPFLRNMYLQYGYTEGLKLELAFGEYLKSKLEKNARLFHFTDANLLYIENNQERDTPPEQLFDKIQRWVNEFQSSMSLNRIIRMGIADYPFLPKAHAAINEKELLDILLMTTSASRELSIKEKSSHWVYLKAIDNAPAASFASDPIRKACKQAISQGLVKVHSSYNNEESIQCLLSSHEA